MSNATFVNNDPIQCKTSSVAIIGAGAAGLVSCKRFLEAGWTVSVFEQTDQIGGTWVYTEELSTEDNPIHTSMYKNLTTNLSKRDMPYLDFPFPSLNSHYMAHKDVLQYLQSYAKKFKLIPNILFNHKVVLIEPSNKNHPLTNNYKITWENKGKIESKEFNKVIICNGHNSIAYIPDIHGIENFKGNISHSHNYRDPEHFSNQNVLIIGSGFSAMDISEDLKNYAKTVHISWKKPYIRNSNDNISYHKKTKAITEEGFILFEDDSILENIDCILYCTGYHYQFDFLSKDLNIQIGFKFVNDLYMHIFPINEYHPQYPSFFNLQKEKTIPPSIAFVGLPMGIIPFPLFDHQVQFILGIWSGNGYLPSISEIIKIKKEDDNTLTSNNLPKYHILLRGQYTYQKELESHFDKEKQIVVKTNNLQQLKRWFIPICISSITVIFLAYFLSGNKNL